MITLFYILIIAAVYHFVWEGILAPSFRFGLRFELFQLRDEVRWLHHKEPQDCTEEVFMCIQGTINNGIRILPKTDITLIRNVERAVEDDDGLRRRIEKRRELMNSCINPEIRELERRIGKITKLALLINTGGWLIYVVPILLVLVCFGWFKTLVGKLRDALLVPERELYRIAPDGAVIAN